MDVKLLKKKNNHLLEIIQNKVIFHNIYIYIYIYRGLGHHYGGDGFGNQNISIQLIEGVEQGDQKKLCHRKIFWQNQLRCHVQNGGNAHCYRKEKKQ